MKRIRHERKIFRRFLVAFFCFCFSNENKNKTLTLVQDRKEGSSQILSKKQTFPAFLPSYRNTREGIRIKYRKASIETQNFIFFLSL